MVAIFDSDIQIGELELALQNAFKTTSKFGPNVAFKDLGKGNGLVTEVGILIADWIPADSCLPSTFAVKVAAPQKKSNGNQLAELSMETMSDEKCQRIVEYHNTEIFILNKLKEHNVHAHLAEVYACKNRANYNDYGYIIMKNYDGIDHSLHMNINLPQDAIELIILDLSEIHKSSRYFTHEEKEKMKGQMFQSTFNVMFEPNTVKSLAKLIKEFGGETMATETAVMENILEEMRQPEYLKFIDETCEHLGIPRLLCHGDVWMCNMLWKRTLEDKYDLQAIVDLQAAQFSCPAMDLVRLFTGCMSGKDRRNDWEKHIKTWWTHMNKSGEAPYTYEQTIEAYRRVFPACAFIVAGSIGAVGESIVKKQPDEDRKARKNLLEKQHAMLQDIIEYHKRNMALIKALPH